LRKAVTYLLEGLGLWFKTTTGKTMAEKLARDTGLLMEPLIEEIF